MRHLAYLSIAITLVFTSCFFSSPKSTKQDKSALETSTATTLIPKPFEQGDSFENWTPDIPNASTKIQKEGNSLRITDLGKGVPWGTAVKKRFGVIHTGKLSQLQLKLSEVSHRFQINLILYPTGPNPPTKKFEVVLFNTDKPGSYSIDLSQKGILSLEGEIVLRITSFGQKSSVKVDELRFIPSPKMKSSM